MIARWREKFVELHKVEDANGEKELADSGKFFGHEIRCLTFFGCQEWRKNLQNFHMNTKKIGDIHSGSQALASYLSLLTGAFLLGLGAWIAKPLIFQEFCESAFVYKVKEKI